MIVYVESNFVLELAFRQEDCESSDNILQLAEAGKIELMLPAYFLGEPYERLVRRDSNGATFIASYQMSYVNLPARLHMPTQQRI